MKSQMKYCKVTAFSLLALVLLALPVSHTRADEIEMVVAAIDGEPVTAGELKRFVVAQGATLPDDLLAHREDARRALQDMITARLLEKEAEKAGVSVSEQELDAYIGEIKRQNQIDDDGLAKLLEGRNLTAEDYRKQVVNDIIRTRIVTSKVRSRITILDEDIDRYLDAHPELVPKDGEIRLEQIFVPFDGAAGDSEAENSKSAAKSQAEEFRSKAVSEGGLSKVGGEAYQDLGYVKLSDLLPELRAEVDRAEPGKVSNVIETPHGYAVLLVTKAEDDDEGKSGGKLGVPQEVRDQIRQQLTQERLKVELDKYLNEELQKRYDIEIKI